MQRLVSSLPTSASISQSQRPVRAVIFDLDGTLTPVHSVWQHIHERLGTWENQGLKSLNAFLAGHITYSEFAERDVMAWRGTPYRVMYSIVDEIPVRRGAQQLIDGLTKMGVRVAILSSGLDLLAVKVASRLGIPRVVANELGFQGGIADGTVRINVSWNGKPEHLAPFCRHWDVDPSEVAVIGDGVGDALLFDKVGLSIAFNACPEVAAAAHVALEGDDLRVLLPVLAAR